jgi:hypothetical protein
MIFDRNFDQENMMMMINPTLVKNDRFSSNKITMNKEQVIGGAMTVEQWSHPQVFLTGLKS